MFFYCSGAPAWRKQIEKLEKIESELNEIGNFSFDYEGEVLYHHPGRREEARRLEEAVGSKHAKEADGLKKRKSEDFRGRATSKRNEET